MWTGKCFNCKKQGHLSHNCPQRPPPQPHTNACASTSQIEEINSYDEEPTKLRSGKKKYSAPVIMEILRGGGQHKRHNYPGLLYEGGFLGCSNPMAWVWAIGCKYVYITRYHSLKVPVSFRTLHAMADKSILVDSGATDNFIHPKLLKQLGLGSWLLERPRKIWNIDGTTNKAGALTHCIDLEVLTGSQQEIMWFLVTDLGGEDLILGYPWLSTFEPKFRWRDTVIDTLSLPIIVMNDSLLL